MIKINFKKQFLIPIALLFFVTSIGILVFSPFSFSNIAKALSGNYSKNTGDSLNITDWNNLDNDFVAKSGDTMSGPINMGSNQITNLSNPSADDQAVNRGTMNTAISSAISSATANNIKDASGNDLKVVCGNTPPGATNWQLYTPDLHSLKLTVDTSATGFTSTPYYFAYLKGGMSYVTTGSNNIYNPDIDSFDLHVVYTGTANNYRTPYGSFITPANANTWQWTIYWCAIGQ